MAKTTLSEGIQDIRGKSGNHVYSNWRGRSYLRSKAINPSNPRSSAQATLRSSMPRFSHLWSTTLTDAQRALWNEYAQREGKIKGSRSIARQIIPPPGVIGSGFNMFVRNNILLQTAGIQVPPAYSAVPPTPADTASSPTNFAGVWNYGWDTRYSENFEDEAVNALPNTWTPPWTYTPAVGDDIKVVAAPTYTGVRASRVFSGGINFTHATIQQPSLSIDGVELLFYTRAAQEDAILFILRTTNGHFTPAVNRGVTFSYWLDGTIKYRDGGVWKIARPYVKDTWYKFRVIVHDALRTYDFSINDVLVAAGISYWNPIPCAYLSLSTGSVPLGSVFIDDISLRIFSTEGLALSWTDPLNASVGSRIRVWLRSYGMNAHLQQIATVALGEEELILSQIRTAQGKTVDISNLPGEYKLQLDSVSPEGRQSAPSNLIEVNVP